MAAQTCEQCRVGRYAPTRTLYLNEIGGHMLLFPNAPAYVCDVCRHTYYDSHFLYRMDYLLDQLGAAPADLREPQAPPGQSEALAWSPSRSIC